MFSEVYLINSRGEKLELDPYSGVVTNPEGKIANGDKINYYSDGNLKEATIPSAEKLERRLLRVKFIEKK